MNEIEARENYAWREIRQDIDRIGGCGNSIWLRATGMYNQGFQKEAIIEEVLRLKTEKLRENPYYPDKNPNVIPASPTGRLPPSSNWTFEMTPKQVNVKKDPYKGILDSVKHIKIEPIKPQGPFQIPLF